MISMLRSSLRRYVKRLSPDECVEAERFVEGLVQSGEAFSHHILALLRNSRAPIEARVSAAWLVRVLEDRRAIPTLIRIVQDPLVETQLRWVAVQGLGSLRSKRAVFPLINVLLNRGEDLWLRKLAANSLGQLGDPRARDALLRFMKDPDEPSEVRGDAAEALTSFQDIRAVPTLLEQLSDPSPEVRFWAVFALGQLGEPDVIPELERVATKDDAVLPGWCSLRREARDAIQSIKERARQRDADA